MLEVGDFAAHPLLDCRLDFVEFGQARFLHLAQMPRHQIRDCKRPRVLLQRPLEPGLIQEPFNTDSLFISYSAAIQIGRRASIGCLSAFVEPDELQPLGDRLRLAVSRRPSVADRMAQRHQHSRNLVPVRFVNQHRAACQEVPVAFERQVDQRIEQRMARRHQGRLRLSLNVLLVKTYPTIPRQHRIHAPDQTVPIPQSRGNARDFGASFLARTHDTANLREGRFEEGADMMGLQAPRRRALHLLPNAAHRRRIEPLPGELVARDEVVDVVDIDRAVDRPEQPLPHFRLLTVADGLHKQLAQGPRFEQLPQDVVDLAAEGFPCRL